MSSFLEEENQMVIDATVVEIGVQLFEQWNDSNLDEGTFYADWQIAKMCNDNYLIDKFHKHYDIKEGDEYFVC